MAKAARKTEGENMKLLAVLSLAILFAVPVYATTGNEWLLTCEDEATHQLCIGYIVGTIDAHITHRFDNYLNLVKRGLISSQIDYCTPDGVTYEQVRRIGMKYMKDHPELTHMKADLAIGRSLVEAFPCPPGR